MFYQLLIELWYFLERAISQRILNRAAVRKGVMLESNAFLKELKTLFFTLIVNVNAFLSKTENENAFHYQCAIEISQKFECFSGFYHLVVTSKK